MTARARQPAKRAEVDVSALDRRTNEVARRYGCDRAVFTVCWGEYEKGLVCRCKEDALRELLLERATPPRAKKER